MQHIAHLRNALVAAILTAILVAPVFGLQLVRQGVVTVVAPNWRAMALASALVFAVQLLRPFMRFAVSRVPKPRFAIVSFSRRPWLLAALLMLAAVWPFFSFAGRSAVDIGTLTLIYIILGLGLNIVVGYAGLLNLGYAGFYAVGAYTTALLYQWGGLGFWQSLPLAGAMAALFGLVLGFPVLRLRGDYLAIVTLGFGEIIRLLMINLVQWTGGPDGISGIPKPSFFGYEIARRSSVEGQQTLHQMLGMDFSAQHMVIYLYLIALALAVFTLWVSNRLVRMPIGRAWEALREDEIACRSLGLNPTGIKLSAFTIGAMFAGLAGAFFASRQGMVNPESFTFMESALVLSIVVLGGMGSQTGVIVAAILLTVLPEFARSFAEYRMLLFGLIMVLMMIWRPQGLIPMQRPQVALQEP